MIATSISNGFRSALAALFFLAAAPSAPVEAASASQQMQFASEPLTIVTAGGKKHKFVVELALNDAQRERGLMFRKTMASDHGMLFDFARSRHVMMWMENTALPLDMLFLDANGTITHIAANAVPYSEAIIDSETPVRYVIELNGGLAAKLGLAIGDKAASATIAKGLSD